MARPSLPVSEPLRARLARAGSVLHRYAAPAVLFFYVVFFSAVGLHLGGDGTPDLRIYHRYNGFVAATGARPNDIAPAQLQTFFFPGLDAYYYRLTTALNDWPRTLQALMPLPYALATFLIFLMGRRLVPADWPRREGLAAAAALFGTTGSAALSTVGTTMSEIVPGLPILLGFALWFLHVARRAPGKGASLAIIVLAGALSGITVGVKLTAVPLFVGLFLTVAVAELPGKWRAVRAAFLFGLAGVVATFLIAGSHWLHNYQLTGNPIFPVYNNIFRSDWVDFGRWTDERFKPLDLPSMLLYPATWAFTRSHRAIEIGMRDPRMLLGLLAAAALLLKLAKGGLTDRTRPHVRMAILLALFFVVSFVLWQYQFSIYRYLAIVESVSGALILGAAVAWTNRRNWIKVGWALVVLGVTVAAFTRYPWWDRTTASAQFHEVVLPNIPDGAMVMILDTSALSFIAPELPPHTILIAANSNLVRPEVEGTLQTRIESTVGAFPGPIWGLENLKSPPAEAETVLKHYGLRRTGDCGPIISNIDPSPFQGCRLEREGASP